MTKLTEEQKKGFFELVKAVEEGKLYRICFSCKDSFKVTQKKFGDPMCDKCLKGVVIPDFSNEGAVLEANRK